MKAPRKVHESAMAVPMEECHEFPQSAKKVPQIAMCVTFHERPRTSKTMKIFVTRLVCLVGLPEYTVHDQHARTATSYLARRVTPDTDTDDLRACAGVHRKVSSTGDVVLLCMV